MKKKGIGIITIAIIVFSSISVVGVTIYDSTPFYVNEFECVPEVDPGTTFSTGFYADIGAMYETLTDDNLRIKVFRYHAPGKDFNYGSQPVLLFSGLLCNMNQFLQHTTPELEKYCCIKLPNEIADWAIKDDNIEEDPMLYYSIAYYLWKMGYDPWFANYRGTGYGALRSENGDKSTCLDDFALYDVRAAVGKVNEITGLHPAIGGHSTGGLTSTMFLQGCQFRSDGHVDSYEHLVNERNGVTEGPETIAGLIGLDPAWIPGMTQLNDIKLLDNLLIWLLFYFDFIVNLRGIIERLGEIPLVPNIMSFLFTLMSDVFGEELRDLFMNTINLDTTNANGAWTYYFVAYAADSFYSRTLAQYMDFIKSDSVRECFRNGGCNENLIIPPKPKTDDGYYYYINNTNKIKVPAIIFLASHENNLTDLVDADKIIRDIVNGKTQTENDECHIIEGAHIDMPGGIRAPIDLYPKLGSWLAKI